MRLFRHLVLALAFVLAFGPFAAIMLTALVAAALGCQPNEAAPGPCIVYGADVGSLLSGMLVTGGLVQITIPILVAILAFWLAIEAVGWIVYRLRGERPAETSDAS